MGELVIVTELILEFSNGGFIKHVTTALGCTFQLTITVETYLTITP